MYLETAGFSLWNYIKLNVTVCSRFKAEFWFAYRNMDSKTCHCHLKIKEKKFHIFMS
jgi:hypothetical protein